MNRRLFCKHLSLQGFSLAFPLTALSKKSDFTKEVNESSGIDKRKEARPKIIHCTDLYRPFVDDDDHFDLAVLFALARSGKYDISGIVCDYTSGTNRFPDIIAVQQLNQLMGQYVPMVMGSKERMRAVDQKMKDTDAGAQFVLDLLQKEAAPVYINIVGTARDVALAANTNPGLFKTKCKGIFLVAGVSTNDLEQQKDLDYNVALDPKAYRAIFNIPCPLYWMPVHDRWRLDGEDRRMGSITENACFYKINEKQIIESLPEKLKRFFFHVYNKSTDANWLNQIDTPVDEAQLMKYLDDIDEKWCTAAFIAQAGLGVDEEGNLTSEKSNSIFQFLPIQVNCDEQNRTQWEYRNNSTKYIFKIEDGKIYQEAMVKALINILQMA